MVNHAKSFPKILSILFISRPSFMTRSFATQKIQKYAWQGGLFLPMTLQHSKLIEWFKIYERS